MKNWQSILFGVVILALAASADPFAGTVYGVYPEGVMVNYGSGAYLVPTQHATFQLGGVTATWTSLQPGQNVNVVVPQTYWPQVVQVPDPYQWKMKYHPSHPHGGPPGQTKKYNGNGKSKGKGKGK